MRFDTINFARVYVLLYSLWQTHYGNDVDASESLKEKSPDNKFY